MTSDENYAVGNLSITANSNGVYGQGHMERAKHNLMCP